MAEQEIAFDLDSLTVGELLAAEEASGVPANKLLTHGLYRLMLGVFVSQLRSSGQMPSWQELTHLRLLDISPGASRSSRASHSPKSSA